ncbi:RNA-binding protein 26 isoform X2 [Hydra vulgaris]|uniref:RNA-binding protein 26 isoform X2 n=1 Tax=Hydra vulgaris TaxID=6087 RepID=A0ABM4D3U2_HYDVU
MIIDGMDALKLWLSKKLEPICDADPVALAKYVIALIKKDKSEAELKALCEDQLDVFLGDQTKNFVADLFVSLTTKSYLPAIPEVVSENVIAKTVNEQNKGSKRKSIDDSDVEKIQKTENRADVGKTELTPMPNEILDKKQVSNDSKLDSNEINNDKNKKTFKESNILKPRNGVKNEVDLEKGNSQERSLKSSSPLQARRRHSSRHGLSRSPNRMSRHSRSSRKDRSRREHGDKSRERRTRRKEKEKCRDYEEKGFCMLGEVCPYDHGHDPLEVDDTNLPQMLTLAGLPAAQPHQNFVQQPPQHLQFLPNILPSRPIVPSVPGALSLNTGLTTVHVQKQTPIPSPIEMNRNQVPIFRPRNSVAFIKNISPASTPGSQQLVCAGEAYNPEAPAIEATESSVIKKDNSLSSKHEKVESDNRTHDELIQIAMGNVPLTPIVGTQPNNIFQINNAMSTMSQTQNHQQAFQMYQNVPVPDILQQAYLPMSLANQQQQQQAFHIQMQLQQQQQVAMIAHQQQQQQTLQIPSRQPFHKNTVLEIRKIPANLNNIVKLSEHFQKFGVITKIQTPFDNDQQAALLEFATYQQATSAYNSPEAILGNRFIKMFWHNPNKQQKNTNSNQQAIKVTNGQDAAVEQQVPKPKKIASSDELIYRNPKVDPRFIQQEKKKELEKLKLDLVKKKQFHYEELLVKQKGILKKLQDGKSLSKEQKEKLLKAFKHCDVAVQKLKKELLEESQVKPKTTSLLRHIKDPKKEILDREIDIYHGNLDGDELEEAKRAIVLLKRQIGFNPRGRGTHKIRGRGSSMWHRGRGRGGFKSNILDNRPKQLQVTGFGIDEKESVIAHFAAFSQMDRIEETTPDKLILTFPTRQSAEMAAARGVKFNGKQLALSWFYGHPKTSINNDTQLVHRRTTRSMSLSEKDLEDELLELDKDEEEMLLAVDDDDEDEVIERSWKR